MVRSLVDIFLFSASVTSYQAPNEKLCLVQKKRAFCFNPDSKEWQFRSSVLARAHGNRL